MLKKLDKLIMKYLGWMLYPIDKQGKEVKNTEIHKHYNNN
jgi:hypothetical protein